VLYGEDFHHIWNVLNIHSNLNVSWTTCSLSQNALILYDQLCHHSGSTMLCKIIYRLQWNSLFEYKYHFVIQSWLQNLLTINDHYFSHNLCVVNLIRQFSTISGSKDHFWRMMRLGVGSLSTMFNFNFEEKSPPITIKLRKWYFIFDLTLVWVRHLPRHILHSKNVVSLNACFANGQIW
jgi:hypothetical protein